MRMVYQWNEDRDMYKRVLIEPRRNGRSKNQLEESIEKSGE